MWRKSGAERRRERGSAVPASATASELEICRFFNYILGSANFLMIFFRSADFFYDILRYADFLMIFFRSAGFSMRFFRSADLLMIF